jgi:hypothetical protein
MQQAITVKMANEQLRSGDEYISSTTWVMSDCEFLADLNFLQLPSALQLHAIEEVWDLLTLTEEVDVLSETNDQVLMVLSSSTGSSTKTATTLQLQGHILHQDSLVLIESGSSHIFLSDLLRSELSAVQLLVTPLTVQMASDQVITCCHHLPSNEWMMSGCYFLAARKFLLIPSFDLVVGRDWLQPHMSSSYNTSYQSAVGHTPFVVLYGYDPTHFGITANDVFPVPDSAAWLHKRQLMTKVIKLRLTRAQGKMKRHANKRCAEHYFVVGDSVPLKLMQHHMVTRGGKLITQVKVLWSDMDEELGTWEDAEALPVKFLGAPAWDKPTFKVGGMSATPRRKQQ